jgi:hypothetical protein
MAIFRGFPAFLSVLSLNLNVAGHCSCGQPAFVFDFHVHNESPPSPRTILARASIRPAVTGRR